jgi:predicted DCC family thiol-disulfide oxidoreductase YuxK
MATAPAPLPREPDQRLVVFDGLCHVCTGWVHFLQRHPTRPPFRLIPMQSEAGRSLMLEHGFDPDDPLTFVVLDGGRCLTQADATIHLMASAGGAWRLICAARLVPRPVRDGLYRLIARNRYRWFGRRSSCYVPEPATHLESRAAAGRSTPTRPQRDRGAHDQHGR